MRWIERVENILLLLAGLDNAALLLHFDHDILHAVVKCFLEAKVIRTEWRGASLVRNDLYVGVVSGYNRALVLLSTSLDTNGHLGGLL
jgi:hypothetical protein